MARARILGAQEALLSARQRRVLWVVFMLCLLGLLAATVFFATLTRPFSNASVATSDLPAPKRTIGAREPNSRQSAALSSTERVSTPLPSAIVNLGTERVSEALARLGIAARGGSASEAYEAYLIAAFCVAGEGFDSTVRQPIGDLGSSERAGVHAGQMRVVDTCKDVTLSLLEERYSNIRIAAVAGVKGASAHFLSAGPPVHVVGAAWADDPNLLAWRRTALVLLQRDANGGDINALALLARVHSEGSVVKKDLVTALAYQIAFNEMLNAKNREESVSSAAANTTWLEEQLLEPERQLARKLSANFLERCCSDRGQSHLKQVIR